MRNMYRCLIAGAIALALSTPAAAQFSKIYFFGDSLSDNGSFKPGLPPGTGLFTTNPGPIWAQVFAQMYGFPARPANQGGTDYAEGGARVTLLPGVPDSPPTGTATPVTNQISNLLTRGALDPNAIYSVWVGADDLFTQLGLVQAGLISQAQGQTNLATAAVELAGQVARLHAAGARYIIVFNLPDVGKTPDGQGSGQAASLTALSSLFNNTLTAALDRTGILAIRLDSFRLLNEVIANPAAYGFTNATAPACGTTPAFLCAAANLVTPDAAQTYVFADGVHPTTAAHKIIAQYAASVLVAPQQMAVLAEAPLAVEQANWRTLDGRMISGINAARSQGRLEAWAAYDYGSPDFTGGYQSGGSSVNTVAVGGDIKLSDRMLAGVQFGYSENKGDVGTAGYRLREPMLTAYVGYGEGPWYLGGTLGAGDLDYRTHRDITLGALTRTESGTAKGWHMVGRVTGGYWFTLGDWVHGPALRLTYQEARVHAFQEFGSSTTTMAFGQQERKSLVTSAGWQASGRIGAFRPFGRASWEYESKDDSREVTASTYGMGGSFSLPAYKPDTSYALFNLGASTDFGKVTGYLTGSASAGKSDGNYYGITLGVRVPL
ncbi:MAG: autotransporter domain-containing protein [Aromatoleum sp.]|nr:autotransporter domain-containing protein [Aromatoleum sp.]